MSSAPGTFLAIKNGFNASIALVHHNDQSQDEGGV
jgi:hypothetical protein